MSAPVSKSEAAELHQHIAALYADAVTKGKQDAVTLRTLREGLVARGFLAAEDAEQWKTTWKEHVKVEFQRLFVSGFARIAGNSTRVDALAVLSAGRA